MNTHEACAPPTGRKRNAVLLALACAHCGLTALLAIVTILLTGAPALFGVGLEWIAPPFLILGLFAIYVSPQWRRAPKEV